MIVCQADRWPPLKGFKLLKSPNVPCYFHLVPGPTVRNTELINSHTSGWREGGKAGERKEWVKQEAAGGLDEDE